MQHLYLSVSPAKPVSEGHSNEEQGHCGKRTERDQHSGGQGRKISEEKGQRIKNHRTPRTKTTAQRSEHARNNHTLIQ